MSIELKTCPFCGGRAVMKAVNKEYGFTIWCQCRKCGARTEGYCPDMNHEDNTITSIEECKDRAAKVWNKRVFGTSMRIRDGDKKTSTASDDFPYYEIPGQMSIEDFIKADEK